MEKVDTNLRAVRLLKGGVHMKKMTRRKYTDEFKDEAVRLVTEQGYKITEAARNLDIHDSVLRRWLKDRSSDGTVKFSENNKLQAELKRVKRENELLRMEREILKKAAAFFAKESA